MCTSEQHRSGNILSCMPLVVLLLTGVVHSAEHAAPVTLTISDGFVNPIGFYDATPTFSWRLPVGGSAQAQTAYHIVVASDEGLLTSKPDLWDSGRVASDASVWIPYTGKALASRQRAYWRVRIWDDSGQVSAWSQTAFFELGLLGNQDWSAQWIRLDQANKGSRPVAKTPQRHPPGKHGKSKRFVPQYFRKTFNVRADVVQARLYVTALGLYQARLNGQRIGDDYMAPGWTPYQQRIETLSYDVTDHMVPGANALAACLAEGWYAGTIRGRKSAYPAHRPLLLMQLELGYADGKRETIVTDQSWKATDRGPLRYSCIFNGEDYDARLEMPGWDTASYDDSTWGAVSAQAMDSKVALLPKRHNVVRITEERKPVTVSTIPGRKRKGKAEPDVFIFDMGQNMVGWPRLNIPVRKGQTIRVRTAELLLRGNLHTHNLRHAQATDYYTAAETGTVQWHPTFTFHGFRYVELSGFPAGTTPESDWVTGCVLHSDFDEIGRFASSHAKLNRLHQNIVWGLRGNFLDIPTDCPQRSERHGWTGDAQIFCATSMFSHDVLSFWMSWLQSCREEQAMNKHGNIPDTVPIGSFSGGSAGWGDVGVTAPWDIYVRTGYRDVLAENYEMMKKWTKGYEQGASDFIHKGRGFFADWLQPHRQDDKKRSGDTPHALVSTAYYGRCAWIIERVAGILGHHEDQARYAALFKNIRNAFAKKFFDESGRMTGKLETQTGYLLALGFELLHEQQRAGAVQGLLRQIALAKGHLRTGFLGTPLLAPVLDEFGQGKVAYQLLFKESKPSWLHIVNQGGTTMWEDWEGNGSRNHYAYGAIGRWMVERVAGLTPDPAHPGYKHFFIRPLPGGPLTQARAEHRTPYGLAVSAWSMKAGVLSIEAVVPPNTTATVIVPSTDADAVRVGGLPVDQAAGVTTVQGQQGGLHYRIGPGSFTFTASLTVP